MKKRVGITGAAGVIGTILRRGLSGTFDLVLYDRKDLATDPGQSCVRADFSRRDAIKGLFDGLDALIHLAGDPRPNAPRESTHRNNFLATSFVFDELRHARVPKVVFASSNFYHQGDIGRELRAARRNAITLESPPTPQCPYGESKVFGEQVGRHLSHLGVRFAALRIGWAVPEDSPVPYDSAYMRAVFCSHRDLVQAFTRAVDVDAGWIAAYAVSRNGGGVFDLRESEAKLGYSPLDDAENYF